MRVFIGLGANLDQPQQQLVDALHELDQLANCQLIKASSLYHSKPVGPQDQPDFVNGVAEIETQLSPIELLDQLQFLEQQHGRIRKRHWGERTLDLDILFIEQQVIHSERLTVPHPLALERSFVLIPLCEIASDYQPPVTPAQAQSNQAFEPLNIQQHSQQMSNDLIKI